MSSCGDNVFIHDDDDDDDDEVEIVVEHNTDGDTIKGSGAENLDEDFQFVIDELEKRLTTTVVDSQEKAYELYCDYAHACGFSVRKGKQYYVQGTNKIRSKVFFCSKQGNKKFDSGPSYKKLDTRTACKAMVQFEVDKDGNWKVNKLHKVHNHEMAKAYEKHILRSARRVSKAQGDTLESLVSSGIKATQAHSYLSQEGGGAASVGFSMQDSYNELKSRRNSIIEKEDAQSLINHFKQISGEEGMFFWDIELDDDGRIYNFFWRDGRSLIDYDFFGDVVVFDATYRMNRYNLICAPFIGVNHHMQTIVFACAFLSDETATSFEWAFRSFLASMGNKQPITFMTDQDQAIMKAASIVFPNSQHRLCLWHIYKNASSYLGGLNSDSEFQNLFDKCLIGSEMRDEFEETWAKMISNFSLDGHKWLERLYNLREKWCTAFSNDTFSAGFKTTSCNESTNCALNGIGNKTTSLAKFIVEFERKLKEWRQSEAEFDFQCKQGKPPLAIRESMILQQTARFYTHKLYKLFEKEFLDILASSHEEECDGDSKFQFNVTLLTKWGPKTSVVHLDTQENVVQCSCKKFETMGLLCTHALAALRAKNVGIIPEKYLLKRWGQYARSHVSDVDQEKIFQLDGVNSDIVYTNRAMKFVYELVSKSQSHEACKVMVWQGLQDINAKVDDYFKQNSLFDSQSGVRNVGVTMDIEDEEFPDSTMNLQDPSKIRSKGRERGERINGHFKKRLKSHSQQKSHSSQVNGRSKLQVKNNPLRQE